MNVGSPCLNLTNSRTFTVRGGMILEVGINIDFGTTNSDVGLGLGPTAKSCFMFEAVESEESSIVSTIAACLCFGLTYRERCVASISRILAFLMSSDKRQSLRWIAWRGNYVYDFWSFVACLTTHA